MARHPVAVPLFPSRSGPRPRLLALVGLCLLLAGWLAGLTRSGRGWLTIGLAALLVVLLAVHHRDGGRRWLARVICEYAVVAALAVLLVAAGVHPQPAHQPGRARASAAGELCPSIVRDVAGGVCDRLEALWRKAKADQRASPTTTTRPHRR
jgi:hypothetical protein